MKRIIFVTIIIILSISAIAANQMPVPGAKYSKTFAEVKAFLAHDKTNDNTWTSSFNCVKFSNMLVKHADAYGFEAEPVIVVWTDVTAHEFVAFATTDAGIVWVEPQDDSIYFIPSNGLMNFYVMPSNTKLCDKYDSYCWPENVYYFYTAGIGVLQQALIAGSVNEIGSTDR